MGYVQDCDNYIFDFHTTRGEEGGQPKADALTDFCGKLSRSIILIYIYIYIPIPILQVSPIG